MNYRWIILMFFWLFLLSGCEVEKTGEYPIGSVITSTGTKIQDALTPTTYQTVATINPFLDPVGNGAINEKIFNSDQWENFPSLIQTGTTPEFSWIEDGLSKDGFAWINVGTDVDQVIPDNTAGEIIENVGLQSVSLTNVKYDIAKSVIWFSYESFTSDAQYTTGLGFLKNGNRGSSPSISGTITDFAIAKDGSVWAVINTSHKYQVSHYIDGIWNEIQVGEDDPNDWVISVEVTPDNSVWFGTIENGIYRLLENQWTHYPISVFYSDVNENHGLWKIQDMTVGPDGTLWGILNGEVGGIFQFTGTDWIVTMAEWYTGDGGYSSIEVTQDGRVWVGMSFCRVLIYQMEGKWYEFSDLPFSVVYNIAESADGSIWIETYDGLFIYRE